MGSMEGSEKDIKQTDVLLPRNGDVTEKRPRPAGAIGPFTIVLLVLAFVVNAAIMVKFTVPWVLSLLPASDCAASFEPGYQVRTGARVPDVTWPVQKYITEEFLAPDMVVNKTGKTSPGFLFINPWGNGTRAIGPAIMTEDNELVWQGPSSDTTNLRLQELHGKSVLTYWNGLSTATFGHGYGSITILDDTYAKVAEVCMKHLDLVTPDDEKFPCHLDMHESFITDRGTVVATAYNVTRYDLSSVGGPKDGWIFDSQFYEIDIYTEEILFRWSSLEHVDQIPISDSREPFVVDGEKSGGSQHSPWDYFHINSVQALEDGGYLVNARHTFAMYKTDKRGDVEWELEGTHGGDFTLDEGIRFAWQHDPRIISDRGANALSESPESNEKKKKKKKSEKLHLTLYNNDNSKEGSGKHQTTGLDLEVDLKKKHVSLNRKLYDPSDEIFSASQGSYQDLPRARKHGSSNNSLFDDEEEQDDSYEDSAENVSEEEEEEDDARISKHKKHKKHVIFRKNNHALVGYGQIAKVKEYNATGAVVYTAEFGASTEQLLVASYRAYRYVWHATPAHYPPKATGRWVYSSSSASSSPIEGEEGKVKDEGGSTRVWMSWNGATDVRGWNVYAGHSVDKLKHVDTVPKSGFETQVSVPGLHNYIQVEALVRVSSNGDGASITSSRRSAVEMVSQAKTETI